MCRVPSPEFKAAEDFFLFNLPLNIHNKKKNYYNYMSINSTKKSSLIKTKKRTRYGGTIKKTQPNKNRFRYKASFFKPSKETLKKWNMPRADTTKPSKKTSEKIIMPPDNTNFKMPPDNTNVKVADVTEHDTDAVHGLLSISMPRDTTKFSGGFANDKKYSRRQRLFNGHRKIKSGIKKGGVEKKSL